ncbi:MAG: hypothetical protein A2664_02735 [Candidatus Taylorbacteria bacterium RIFCSPHIGHO2_01_FULL_46_22b]|uniref:Uncharacterized protein n=1 Tax=Candidatus Taylorbacteria bacterium RIFCSPHIGHO2_01_FULL_46_22b TaxID=1802301 RepID=A0A1G2M5Z1_9BACT|nr:MAG: hypothetical protein A2664_02735 [Candidatus Taylorbacteria bacterium RIFCSPHIGHO2_01_FULL_46_22b]
MDPELIVLLTFLSIVFGALAIIGLPILLLQRRYIQTIQCENTSAASVLAEKILEQRGWPERQSSWVNGSQMEYVVVLHSEYDPLYHILWARVRVAKKKITVTIEHSYKASRVHLDEAQQLMEAFKRKGVEARVIEASSNTQPTPKETGALVAY